MPVLPPLQSFTFELFCAKLDAKESEYIRLQIEDFIKSFTETCVEEPSIRPPEDRISTSQPSSPALSRSMSTADMVLEDYASRQARRGREFRRILESFCVVILKDSFWELRDSTGQKAVSDDSEEFADYAEIVMLHLESYIAPRIHRNLFVPDKRVDWDFTVRCKEFEWLRPTNLDIQLLPQDLLPIVERCMLDFTNMAFEKIPHFKCAHLHSAWKLLQACLRRLNTSSSSSSPVSGSSSTTTTTKMVSMDDIMPLLVYIVIKSQPPQLHSDLHYLSATCRDMSISGSLTPFYIQSTLAAIEFIRTLTLNKLSTANEKELKPGRLNGVLTDSDALTTTEKAQAAIKELFENGKGRFRTTFEKVADSVNDTVAKVSLLGPVAAVAAAVRPPSTKLAIAAATSKSLKNAEKSNSASSPPIESEFRPIEDFVPSELPSISYEPENASIPPMKEDSSISLNSVELHDFSSPPNGLSPAVSEIDINGTQEALKEENKEDESDWTKKYRFWGATPDSLSTDDVRQLLEDYRQLATQIQLSTYADN